MSLSEKSSEKIKLVIEARDPFVSIFVIDGKFDLVSRGTGRLEDELRPGLYQVKFKAGLMIKDIDIALEPGKGPVYLLGPELEFSTSAPLEKTSTARSTHLNSAYELSREVSSKLGEGGQLFVFVRDLEEGISSDPATGLTLRGMDGKILVDFKKEGRRSIEEQWAGAMMQLDPGFYRLRINNRSAGVLEQTIVVSPGWQTQVFLMRRPYGATRRKARYADISNASILMARQGEGFNPDREDLRWTEMARIGLAEGHSLVPARELHDMLWGKFQNPLLGIFAIHLMLAGSRYDLSLMDPVLDNLQRMLGDHPDVIALKLRRAELEKQVWKGAPAFEAPPMLRNSWAIVVNASAQTPELVPAGSFSSQIAMSLWGGGTWLVWTKPSSSKRVRSRSRGVIGEGLEEFLPELRALASSPGALESLTVQGDLNDLEQNLLQYISLSNIQPRYGTLTDEDSQEGKGPAVFQGDEPPEEDMSEQSIVQALRVPNTTARQAAASLIEKLKGRTEG